MSSPPAGDETGQAWFWAKATYKAVHVGAPRKRHLWERKVLLIQTPRDSDYPYLRPKAEQIAREQEHEYVAIDGTTVRWVFQGIEDIQWVYSRTIEEGTEVYYEFFERVDKTRS